MSSHDNILRFYPPSYMLTGIYSKTAYKNKNQKK